jgi:hypothetical protein
MVLTMPLSFRPFDPAISWEGVCAFLRPKCRLSSPGFSAHVR